MSRVLLSSPTTRSSAPQPQGDHSANSRVGGCPFGANCSCVFAPPRASNIETPELLGTPGAAPARNPALKAEIRNWTNRGWQITSVGDRDVVLERRMQLGFCMNLGLTVVTAGLWLFRWVPQIRHPRIDTRVVTVSANGDVATTQVDKNITV